MKKNLHKLNRIILCRAPIIFIVEDDNKEGEYEFLIKKIFNELENVDFKVFAMDGKQGVKDFYEYIQGANVFKKKYLFLVDGDFEILRSDFERISKSYGDNFCFLEKYNIENYIFDEIEINNYLRINCNASKENLLNRIDYVFWKKNIEEYLGQMFLFFFALYQFHIDFDCYTIPEHMDKYKHISLNNSGIPTEEGKCKCKDEVINAFCMKNNYDKKKFINVIEKYERKLDNIFNKNIFDNISDKYLLHSIVIYIKSIIANSSDDDRKTLKGCVDETNMRKFLLARISNKKFTFLFDKWEPIIHEIIFQH